MANSSAITDIQPDYNNSLTVKGASGKSGEEILASIWGMNSSKTAQITNISRMYNSKHGMFASVPIMCRGADCHFKDVCAIDQADRTIGERCPMEIAAIVTRFNQWCAHFNIDASGEIIQDKDLVDASLIKDLVVTEVQQMRAENKIAQSGDFMANTLIEIDKKCKPYYGMTVTPEAEMLMTLQDRKMKILNQLNATRKDKANDKRKETASDDAIRIFQQMQKAQKESQQQVDIMDVDFDENGNIIVEDAEENKEEIIIDQQESIEEENES